MLKRFYLQALPFIPDAGAEVQSVHVAYRLSRSGGGALVEALAQQLREEVVITVPAPLMVQRHQEQVGAVQRLQGGLPGRRGVVHDGITERTAQALEDGGPQQKRLDRLGPPLEDLLHQIVQHELVAAGE
jgi:hypothetical protein